MVRSGTPEPAGGDQSLGDLVSLAARDISQLIRYEVDLAKTELRADMRRAGMAGVLFGIAAFFGCLVLLSLCFAYAYMLHWAGVPGGLAGAFAFTALTLVVLAAIAVLIAVLKMRRLSGMKKTRESVTEGLGMLRRDGKDHKDGQDGDGAKALGPDSGGADGQRLEGGAAHDGQRRASLPAAGKPAGDSALPDGRRSEIAGRSQR